MLTINPLLNPQPFTEELVEVSGRLFGINRLENIYTRTINVGQRGFL